MKEHERDSLFGKYLSGEIGKREAALLLRWLRENPALAEELAGLQDVDLLLDYWVRTRLNSGAGLVEQHMAGIRDHVRASQFADRVLSDISVKHKNVRAYGRRTKPTRSLRFLPPLAVAAGLLAALGIGLWLNRTTLETPTPYAAIARVESVRGAVSGFVDIAATEPRPLRPGDKVLAGMRIETGADSAATLAWLDNTAHLTLAESSVLSMPICVPSVSVRASSAALQKRMVLHRGALTATVGPQPTASPFEAETPHALATVLGTRFRLEVRGETGNGEQDARRSTLDARLPAADAEHPDTSINHQPFSQPSTINHSPNHQPSTILPTINHQPLTMSSTWLHVEEGRVRFTRLADEAEIEVAAGEFAVAGAAAEDFALKTYPDGTALVDGPIIFQDDFSEGLGNWNVEILKRSPENADLVVLVENPAPEALAQVSTQRGTGRAPNTSALVLDQKVPGTVVGAMLSREIGTTSFSVELHVRYSPLRDSHFHSVSARERKVFRVFPADAARPDRIDEAARQGRWMKHRYELRFLRDEQGEPFEETRFFIDNRLRKHFWSYPKNRVFGFMLTEGRVQIDNVVMRESVPAGGPIASREEPGRHTKGQLR